MYCTLKALKNDDKEETKNWLRNWFALSCFFLSERLADPLLKVFPLYFEAKLAVLIWLTVPQFRAAELLYKDYFMPLFLRHENSIDRIFGKIQTATLQAIHFIAAQAFNYLKQQGLQEPEEPGQVNQESKTSREITDDSE
jgi:hypothetical protein